MLPKNYEVPKSEGNYLRLQQGENTFRVLSSAIVGWVGWVQDKDGKRKPQRYPMDQRPTDTNIFDQGRLNHFWAFIVWNVEDERIQIMEITQKTIQQAIKALIDNKKWGDPKNYDITITRVGEKLDTEYTVMPNPHTEISDAILAQMEYKEIDIEKLFTGEDPFGKEEEEEE